MVRSRQWTVMVSRNQGHGDVGIFIFRVNFCACLEACVRIFEINAKKTPQFINTPALDLMPTSPCFVLNMAAEREREGAGGRSFLYIANLQFAYLLFAFACIIIHQYQWRSKVRSLRRRRRAVNPFLMKASYNIRAPSLSQLSA